MIECHTTGLNLRKCPLNSCLWSDKKGGCNFVKGVTPESLGTSLGMTDSEIKASIRKGKSNITRTLTLDAYIGFIKTRLVSNSAYADKVRSDPEIDRLLRTSGSYEILITFFETDNFILSSMLKKKYLTEFCKHLGRILPYSACVLVGVRKQYDDRINNRLKELVPKTKNKKVKVPKPVR